LRVTSNSGIVRHLSVRARPFSGVVVEVIGERIDFPENFPDASFGLGPELLFEPDGKVEENSVGLFVLIRTVKDVLGLKKVLSWSALPFKLLVFNKVISVVLISFMITTALQSLVCLFVCINQLNDY
jgi:hypothetical protein